MLKNNLIKYRLIENHIKAVNAGKYEEARRLLQLLRRHRLSVGIGDDAGYAAEIIAEECGCRIRYSRNYNVSNISW